MSYEPGVDRTVSVSDDGDVRVEKSFARDEFPVPAIKFRLVSGSDDPVHVRLVDRIPEDFPMEGVGFHPDYESDNWTAYGDHRVEYERSLAPGESTVTVYGVRLDDSSDVAGFLDEPTLERPPVPGAAPADRPDSDVDDILGTDRSQLVRDALQGNGRLANRGSPAASDDDVPGVEPLSERDHAADTDGSAKPADTDPGPAIEPAIDPEPTPDSDPSADSGPPADGEPSVDATTDGESDSPEPRTVPPDPTPVVREADSVTPIEGTDDAEPDAVAGGGTPDGAGSDAVGAGAVEADADAEDAAEADAGPAAEADTVDADGDVEPDDADGPEGYVDIGVEAEASDTADPSEPAADAAPAARAAADASGGLAATLAAEIRSGEVSEADLETLRGEFDSGLPRSDDVRIRRLQSQLADLIAYTDAIEEFIDNNGTGTELVERLEAELGTVTAELDDLHEGLDVLDNNLAATDERLDDVDDTAATAAAGVDDVHDRADDIEDRLDDVDADLDGLIDDIDDVAADVGDVAADLDDTDDYLARVDDDLGGLRADVSAVGDDVTDARESLSADIADLRAEVAALTDELDRVDTIEAEIEGLQTFRDRLNSAFGPGGGSGNSG
jgi:ABC-type transporter Mla subunit MlaD